MPKHIKTQLTDFGKRLAALRKATGYTQKQLAEEIGVTRRMIAYYETESTHPPANLLADLANELNTSTDELLGLQPVTPPKLGQRFYRRLQQIERLGPKARKQIVQLLDSCIKAEQLKEDAKAGH